MMNRILLSAAILFLPVVAGCDADQTQQAQTIPNEDTQTSSESKSSENSPSRLVAGMKLTAAREMILAVGGRNVVMAILNKQKNEVHPDVYDLPNGKVIILNGEENLESISILDDPEQPKSKRVYREIDELVL